MIKKLCSLAVLLIVVAVVGCGTSNQVVNPIAFNNVGSPVGTIAKFNPLTGNLFDIPIPNDILRSQTTGLNALPGTGEPFTSFNSIAGFSTAGNIVIPFTGPVLASTVTNANIIIIDTVTAKAVNVTLALTTDANNNSTVTATPVTPLIANHLHIAIVTPFVLGANNNQAVTSDVVTNFTKLTSPVIDIKGHSLLQGFTDQQAQTIEAIRLAFQPMWAAVEKITGVSRGLIPNAFPFTTQSEFTTLQFLRTLAQTQTPKPTIDKQNGNFQGTFVGTTAVNNFYNDATNNTLIPGFSLAPHNNIGAIVTGTYQDPNFISDPLNGPFTFNAQGQPVAAGTNTIRFNVYLPNSVNTFPCVIFQHGITRTKLDTGLIANTLCSQGLGVIAIDAVLHGDRALNPTLNTVNGIPGLPAGSGTGFINLNNLRLSRDNLRQTVFDLNILARMVASGQSVFFGGGGPIPVQVIQVGTPSFATNNITFGGQSLGGIIGDVFMTTESSVNLGVLNVPGGRLLSLLLNSQTIGPTILAGLAQAGIQPGTANFNAFVFIAQTVVDDADPFNYGAHTLAGDLKGNTKSTLLFQEMVADNTVPNSAGTDLALSLASGANVVFDQVNAIVPINGLTQVASPFHNSGLFQFQSNPAGDHGFLLDGKNLQLTGAAQTQFVTFLLTGLGGQVTIQRPVPTGSFAPVNVEANPDHLVVFPKH